MGLASKLDLPMAKMAAVWGVRGREQVIEDPSRLNGETNAMVGPASRRRSVSEPCWPSHLFKRQSQRTSNVTEMWPCCGRTIGQISPYWWLVRARATTFPHGWALVDRGDQLKNPRRARYRKARMGGRAGPRST